MAHQTTVTGGVSELIATAALLNAGWQVSKPEVPEVFDRIARHPEFTNNEWKTLQIKTIRPRNDRDGTPIVYATKGNGEKYTPEDCDYMIGVSGYDVYIMKCRSLREYWYPKNPNEENEWILIGSVTPTVEENEKEAI